MCAKREEKRLFFRLNKRVEEWCKRQGRDLPKRDALQKRAKKSPWTFWATEFNAAMGPKRGPFSEGVLFAMADFLGTRMEDIVEFTADVPERLISHDVFRIGWGLIVDKANESRFPTSGNSKLATREAVRKVADDIQVEVGWQLTSEADRARKPSRSNLIERASRHIGLTPAEFPDLLERWWASNQWVCLRAFGTNKSYYGATCLLPVTEATYHRIKTGKVRETSILSEDVVDRSSYFIAIAGLERYSIKQETELMTSALSTCYLTQLAVGLPENDEGNLHVLSFAAVPISTQRLLDTGFRPLGRNLRGTTFELMECGSESPGFAELIRGIQIARQFIDWTGEEDA